LGPVSGWPWDGLLLVVGPALLAGLIATQASHAATAVALAAGILLLAHSFCSARWERNLLLWWLYIGLLDGYLRLSTGNGTLTLFRDLLLYALVAGCLLRLAVGRKPVRLPPASLLVLAFVATVLVQVLNPADGTLAHSLAALRPHLEFVPLFFLGYAALRTERRLRLFLATLLVIGAANGVVSLVQFNSTPQQLASWGPGYAERIMGTGDVSGRTFADAAGTARVRPFGLGADLGAGGAAGVLAIGGVFALVTYVRRSRFVLLSIVMAVGVALAVVTSQQRAAVVGAVLAAVAYAALVTLGRNRLSNLAGVAAIGVIAYIVIATFASHTNTAALSRYRSIAPGSAVTTAYQYRIGDLSQAPTYIAHYPLGAGLGSVGPGASTPGRPSHEPLDAEGEINFLVIELGVPGLLALGGFTLYVLWLAATGVPRLESDSTRKLLAALAAPVFAIAVSWLVGITSTSVPVAPYFWFAAGGLIWWLRGRPPQRAPAPT
jgi:hypothetical protein